MYKLLILYCISLVFRLLLLYHFIILLEICTSVTTDCLVMHFHGNTDIGISVVGGVAIIIRCADDKAVVANSQKGLQLMDNLNRVMQKFGQKINVKKIKVMCISKHRRTKVKIYIDGLMLEQVDYLGFNCPDMLQFDTEDGYLKSD